MMKLGKKICIGNNRSTEEARNRVVVETAVYLIIYIMKWRHISLLGYLTAFLLHRFYIIYIVE